MPFINDKLESQRLESQRTEDHCLENHNYESQSCENRRDNAANLPEKSLTPAKKRLINSRFLFDPDSVIKKLRRRIVGQDHVLTDIFSTLKVLKADIADSQRPLYVGLFVGATGVGKTELVRVLAEAIHGQADAFCRIDMNTLAQDHYAAAITGAPPGYVGSKEGNSLIDVEKVQGSYSRPGIVLLDEIEKAGTEVIRALLNVIETGQLRLTS